VKSSDLCTAKSRMDSEEKEKIGRNTESTQKNKNHKV
jgi:hypothetical protein